MRRRASMTAPSRRARTRRRIGAAALSLAAVLAVAFVALASPPAAHSRGVALVTRLEGAVTPVMAEALDAMLTRALPRGRAPRATLPGT